MNGEREYNEALIKSVVGMGMILFVLVAALTFILASFGVRL